METLLDVIREIIRKIDNVWNGKSESYYEIFEISKNDLVKAEKILAKAINEKSEAKEKITIQNDKKTNTVIKKVTEYQLNKEFLKEYDKWNKNDRRGSFLLGKTSKALRKAGLEVRDIYIDKSKILKVLDEHKGMSDNVIKEIPYILQNPIIVLKSQTQKDSKVIFGNVFDNNKKPVLVALLLSPDENINSDKQIYKVTSAYGKENLNVIQDWLNNTDNIEYIEENKKRTYNWLSELGLQLPVALNQLSSINASISQNDTNMQDNNKKNQGLEDYKSCCS